MEYSFFISITLIVLISFLVKKNKFSINEIIFLWLVASFLYTFVEDIAIVNYKVVRLNSNIALYWNSRIIDVILIPIVIISYIELMVGYKVLLVRICLTIIFTGILIAIQYLAIYFNIIEKFKLRIVTQSFFLIALLITTFLLFQPFRKVYIREGKK
ncbi:hypothetical protein [Sporosalibacterium faouarense]|uniref:hypothetical protein n=1 Tax=Sporosalibacterium faouarense TaxID=516123 RepID=UPI00141C48EF|nr:hypothetical protein [Sporosalibacterium faouarense]MTI47441.1 hypothetical protein [Bacillota bacterium]